MNLSRVHPGSIVGCEKLGRKFRARFTGRPADGFAQVEPIDRNVSYRRLRASEVREVLTPAKPSGQMPLGELR